MTPNDKELESCKGEGCGLPLLNAARMLELAEHPDWITPFETKALIACKRRLEEWCGDSYVAGFLQNFEKGIEWPRQKP